MFAVLGSAGSEESLSPLCLGCLQIHISAFELDRIKTSKNLKDPCLVLIENMKLEHSYAAYDELLPCLCIKFWHFLSW